MRARATEPLPKAVEPSSSTTAPRSRAFRLILQAIIWGWPVLFVTRNSFFETKYWPGVLAAWLWIIIVPWKAFKDIDASKSQAKAPTADRRSLPSDRLGALAVAWLFGWPIAVYCMPSPEQASTSVGVLLIAGTLIWLMSCGLIFDVLLIMAKRSISGGDS